MFISYYDTSGVAYDETPMDGLYPVLPGDVRDVTVLGKYAYVVDYYNGLFIVDISNPEVPVLVGRYYTGGNTLDVAVSDNYVYVGGITNGLYIFDISDPAAPVLVGSYDTEGRVSDVAVLGNYAYVADTQNGLFIVDISNPIAPVLAGSYYTTDDVVSVTISGNYVYVGAANGGILIFDISNSSVPMLVGSYNTWGVRDVAISGNYAYVADGNHGLVIMRINITNLDMLSSAVDIADFNDGDADSEAINAEITSANFESGYFAQNDKIKAYITVENKGDVAHTFYVGYSVQDPVGKYYDAPYKSITLSPGQTNTVDIDWTVPEIDIESLGSFNAIAAVWEEETSSGLTGKLDFDVKENAFTIAQYNGDYLEIKSISPNIATRGTTTYLQIQFENVGDEPFVESDVIVTIQEMDDDRLRGGKGVNYIAKNIKIPTINPGATYTWKFGIYDGIYFGNILTDYIIINVKPENGEIIPTSYEVKPFTVNPHPKEYIDATAGVINTLTGNDLSKESKNILAGEGVASALTDIFSVHLPNKDFKSVGINIGKIIFALKPPNPVSYLSTTGSTGMAISQLILHHGGQDLITGIIESFSSNGEDVSAIIANCPINLMIIDESGNRLGIDEDGTIYEEFPNSSAIITGDDTDKSILLIYSEFENYTTMVSGTDDGTFDMLLASSKNGNVRIMNYTGIRTSDNSIAIVHINDTSDYSVAIDLNGDGIIDNNKLPSSSLMYQVPKVVISKPISGSQYEKDSDVTFQGLAYDQYNNPIDNSNLQWGSDIDGSLGIGNEIDISSLSVGKHSIYLKAIDSNGHYSIKYSQIEIQSNMGEVNVNEIATDSITSPSIEKSDEKSIPGFGAFGVFIAVFILFILRRGKT